MASRPLAVNARRRYEASPERVFRAFTDPALLVRWLSPSPDTILEVLAHELRVSGRYRFRYRQPSGGSDVVTGTFLEISPPRRLVFTWTWEPPDPHAGIETLVTIELVPEGDATLVVVTHERFPDEVTRERHDVGWCSTLPRLAQLL